LTADGLARIVGELEAKLRDESLLVDIALKIWYRLNNEGSKIW